MYILGIESSCDETGAAVVADGSRLLSNVVASQEALHAKYGGIVPEVASRQQLLAILPVLEEAIRSAGIAWKDLSGVAVTYGPGLGGSLLVGLNAAKAVAWAHGLPLIGVNHLEGHIYANWLRPEPVKVDLVPSGKGLDTSGFPFPLLCLLVSGGHTGLFLMADHGRYQRLGGTRDDAAGEAFDKVARLLGLGFPGGPAIQRAASGAAPSAVVLPRPMLPGTHDFSFSGLKTAMLRIVEGKDNPRRLNALAGTVPPEQAASLAAAFQQTVVDVLVEKTLSAARQYGVRQVLLGGGVAANTLLREVMAARSPLPVHVAPPSLCTDNGAMIAAAGYYRLQAGDLADWSLDVEPSLRLA